MLTINAAQLKAALSQSEVKGKTGLPVMDGTVRMENGPEGLQLGDTDLELGAFITPRIESNDCAAWVRIVNRKALAKVLGGTGLAKKTITIEPGEGTAIVVRKGKRVLTLDSRQDPQNWAEVPNVSGTPIGVLELGETMAKVDPYVTSDESRFAVSGALLKGKDAVATDGHRLIKTRLRAADPVPELLLPKKTVAKIGKVIVADSVLTIGDDGKHVRIEGKAKDGSRVLIISRRLEGTFPQYEKIIPADSFNGAAGRVSIKLDADARAAMAESIKSLPLSDRTHALKITCNGGVTLSGEDVDMGAGSEPMPFGYDGAEAVATFNGFYLLDALKSEASGLYMRATMAGDEGKPGYVETQALITTEDGSQIVLMPMRA